MKLDLDRTEPGVSELAVAGEMIADFGAGGPHSIDLDGVLRVDNLESRFILRGELAARSGARCDRCLEPFSLSFPVPVEIVVLRDFGAEDEGDTPVIHQLEGEVDLTETLREAVVIAVPLQRVCRPECQGLCPQCGADLNQGPCGCPQDEIDPRWAGLPD
jgi:uncharacterized protein